MIPPPSVLNIGGHFLDAKRKTKGGARDRIMGSDMETNIQSAAHFLHHGESHVSFRVSHVVPMQHEI